VLLLYSDKHIDWVATQVFYSALHVVEATIFEDQAVTDRHFTSHENRNNFLKSTRRYQKVYTHYKALFTDSLVARYMEDDQCDFLQYLSLTEIIEQSIGHHLKQIGASCDRLVGHKLFQNTWNPKERFQKANS